MTNTDDTYNGWTNRETWALDMFLSNDQGLYGITRERVRQIIAEYRAGQTFKTVGILATRDNVDLAAEAVREVWDDLMDPDQGVLGHAELLQMVRTVGSLHRVNWAEIGTAWLSNLDED